MISKVYLLYTYSCLTGTHFFLPLHYRVPLLSNQRAIRNREYRPWYHHSIIEYLIGVQSPPLSPSGTLSTLIGYRGVRRVPFCWSPDARRRHTSSLRSRRKGLSKRRRRSSRPTRKSDHGETTSATANLANAGVSAVRGVSHNVIYVATLRAFVYQSTSWIQEVTIEIRCTEAVEKFYTADWIDHFVITKSVIWILNKFRYIVVLHY